MAYGRIVIDFLRKIHKYRTVIVQKTSATYAPRIQHLKLPVDTRPPNYEFGGVPIV
jgi:hypothetical protein